MDLYSLLTGPLVTLVSLICLGGLAGRTVRFLALARERDAVIFTNFQPRWAALSILRWLLPLNVTALASPAVTLAGFALHAGLLLVGLFGLGHAALLALAWNLDWWAIPDGLADGLTLACLGAVAFFALRRLVRPEVKALTSAGDWVALSLAAAPMLTGYLAAHGYGPPEAMLLIHAASGCAMIALIPFTRLSHALFFFLSRAVTGSDFGKRQVGAW
jgi:nitrate reductase gamma subunit